VIPDASEAIDSLHTRHAPLHTRHAPRGSVRIDTAHQRHVIIRFDGGARCGHATFTVANSEPTMTCSHADRIRVVKLPRGAACEDCVLTGDRWLQLRMCMECGYVGCCDSSKNKHAIGHFHTTQHPITRSIEAGEEWAWCYLDQLWFERLVLA
jgi:Zn-finger in ubiquitin-hydrolases and other protein